MSMLPPPEQNSRPVEIVDHCIFTAHFCNFSICFMCVWATVKSFLGNGQSVTASSNGFYVDDTPAELDVFFYVDVNVNEFEPTSFQSSESTISVLWSFIDRDSMVKVDHSPDCTLRQLLLGDNLLGNA